MVKLQANLSAIAYSLRNNFFYRTYFENLTGNLIEHILKNKFTSLFSLNFMFLKYYMIFKCYNHIVELRLLASYFFNRCNRTPLTSNRGDSRSKINFIYKILCN